MPYHENASELLHQAADILQLVRADFNGERKPVCPECGSQHWVDRDEGQLTLEIDAAHHKVMRLIERVNGLRNKRRQELAQRVIDEARTRRKAAS